MQKKALITLFLLMAGNLFAEQSADTVRVYRTPSITVSTSRAEERRSPVPYSQITMSEIERRHSIKDLPQTLSEMPSIIVFSENGNGIGYSNLTMRGFNQRRIAVTVNGIPQNDPEDHNMYWINLPDIASGLDNIQVQRGAGLSSNGFPAIGGSINLETSNFASYKGALLETGVGFQEYSGEDKYMQSVSKYSLQLSSGLIDNKYAMYGRLSRINSSGYRDNSWAELNSYFLGFARFDSNFTTQINVFGGPVEDGLAYTGLPKEYIKDRTNRRLNYNYWSYDSTGNTNLSWITSRRKQEIENFSQPHYELLNDWYASDNITFKSSLFFYSGKGFFDFDGTGWTDKNTYRLTPENGFPNAEDPRNPIIRAFVYNRHGGWIPRMILKHDRGTLTLGSEIRIHRSEHWGKIRYAENLPENYDPDYKFYQYDGERDIFSFFAREEFYLDDRTILTGELQSVYHAYRINDEKLGIQFTKYTDINGNVVGNGKDLFDISYFFVNPRIGINHNFTDNNSVYGFLAYTSREPRMVNLYNASSNYSGALPLFEGELMTDGTFRYDFSKPIIKPESMINLEIGYLWKSEKLNAGINLYYMKYFDELVKSGKVDIFGNPIDGNAPRTTHLGAELQFSSILLNCCIGKFELSGNATFSINEINEYDFRTNSGAIVALEGNEVAGFPSLMGNLRFSYSIDDFYMSWLLKYVGKMRTDNFGDLLATDANLISHLGYDYYTDNNLDAYLVHNIDFGYSFRNVLSAKSIEIRAQIFNAFNTLYAAGAEGKDFFPAAERNIYLGLRVGI